MVKNLDALFNPENIAVVGASNSRSKAGCVILQNLIRKKYSGKIFPVNPREEEVLSLKSYGKLSEIEDKVELVVLITPSSMIYELMEDLEKRMEVKKDVRAIVCAAADYGETKTEEGIRRQDALINTAKKYGIRVVGPNCIGVIDNGSRVDTTFVETGRVSDAPDVKGGISFISQSGAIAASLLMIGESGPVPVGFNKFVSVGNMADADFIDFLEYLEGDDTTKVIGMYMEGYPKARDLIGVMERIARKKPIVVLKVGRSEKGASAANSHTGSLAGSDMVYDSAFKQSGIIRVDTIEELLDTLKAFDRLPLPEGNNLFLLTQAGGPGIYCTDAAGKRSNVVMPVIKRETKEELTRILPKMASVCCPEGYADITAAATVEHHVDSLRLVLDDENVSAAVLITVIPTFLPQEELGKRLAEMYINEGYINKKPVFVTIMAGNYVRPAREILECAGVYTFDTPDRAVNAASNLMKYSTYLKRCAEGGARDDR
jgi:acetate---CoA ligase (ADP-forming) subunit alpha